jgi:hypothetical protein
MLKQVRLWQRWKRLAHRAAVFQSNVLLWVLYYVVFVPLALVQRPFTDPLALRQRRPAWHPRAAGGENGVEAARRQF